VDRMFGRSSAAKTLDRHPDPFDGDLDWSPSG
jgi:hypothetical protein